jgi:hypothetical protein
MAEIDPKRVRSIFLAAVEDHAPDQWDHYLDGACGDLPGLRRRVEVLLRGHERANDLLDDPDAAPVAPARAVTATAEGTVDPAAIPPDAPLAAFEWYPME